MRFVDGGAPPDSLDGIKNYDSDGKPIWCPKGKSYARFMKCLEKVFDKKCAYCGQDCQYVDTNALNDDRIDHFRPRCYDDFESLVFDWNNLNYVCALCNSFKGNQFPGKTDPAEGLPKMESESRKTGKRYIDPSAEIGYVNPRDANKPRPEQFFTLSKNKAHLVPNPELCNIQWSRALRTIYDLKLDRTDTRERYNVVRRQQAEGIFSEEALRYAKLIGHPKLEQIRERFPQKTKCAFPCSPACEEKSNV